MNEQIKNPVKKLPLPLRNHRLLESFKRNDNVVPAKGGAFFVSSDSRPGTYHRVTYDTVSKNYGCSCEWWAGRGEACRHLVRVSWEVAQRKGREGNR